MLLPRCSAIAPRDDAKLDRLFAAQRASHPDQSGARLVSLGTDAFALRVLSARAAVRSLDLQYYIWHTDATGRYLANEALLAADRGVRVRLLIDDMDARSRDAVLMALDRHPLIEIRLFNPFATRSGTLRTLGEFFTRGWRLNHRMHNKSWIADGRIALVGGRNIGDEYFSASPGVNFVDLDVLLAGAAVEEATRSYDEYWNSESSVPIAHLRRTGRNKLTLSEVRQTLAATLQAQADDAYAQRVHESSEIAHLMQGEYELAWSSEVRVVADDPRKATRGTAAINHGVLESLAERFSTTRRELLLISPYFVPGAGGTDGMRALTGRGAGVEILTNSLAATDVAAVHSGYSRYRKALLECGVKLYELKPAPEADDHDVRLRLGSSKASLHTKAAIVDREHVFVGSFNLDPRSVSLNCEQGVLATHPALAEELEVIFERMTDGDRAWRVDRDAQGRLQWRDGERTEHRDPDASLTRRITARLLRWLPLDSQL